MSQWRLISASLGHYRGINLAVLAGVALTSAILSGALIVGDSVKESLRRNAAARISNIGSALIGGERFFTQGLADRIGENAAPVLQVRGTVSSREGGQRVNHVQIVGVDDRFWNLSLSNRVPSELDGNEWMAINRSLADRAVAKKGETLILRVEVPGAMSKDAPLSGESEQTTPFTGKITRILDAEDFGLYSLRAEQLPPATVFLPLSRLQATLEQESKANVILSSMDLSLSDLQEAAEANWDLHDIGLKSAPIGPGTETKQILSNRVFFDEKLSAKLDTALGSTAPVLTYLANSIRAGDRSTPYSMVAGVGAELNGLVDTSLGDDEILVSDWMAADLAVEKGDELSLEYYVVESGRQLVEKSQTFRVAGILPLGEKGWDRSWTPEFPGIFDVDDLDEWEPGIPIDRSKLRDKDEVFWDEHRATPKAFVTLNAARQMWSNRFGDTTSVRFRDAEIKNSEDLLSRLRSHLSLEELGMNYRDLSEEARFAVAQSFDFGALFASMSFFLIVAALVLVALIFTFGIEQRSAQVGLLLSLGWTHKKVRRLFLAEALLLAVAGAFVGLLGGYIYTKLALAGMSGAWRDAAAGIEFVYHWHLSSPVIAGLLTVAFALFAVWLASRRILHFHPSELITGSDGILSQKRGRIRWSLWVGFASVLAGIACLLAPKEPGSMAEQGLFFGAGFIFVIAGICGCALVLSQVARPSDSLASLSMLGRQNALRKKGRSLAVVGLMAAGVFMVTAINSFRLEGGRGAERRTSGTGGFAYVGESTLPIYEDLNSDEGREKYGLHEVVGSDPEAVRLIPFRVSDGEDASCLNLNRAQRPRLMGVDWTLLVDGDEAPFSFSKNLGTETYSDWYGLSWRLGQNEGGGKELVAGVIDMNTATYALQKKLGSEVDYLTSGETPFAAKLVGFLNTSILQGNIIISEEDFIRQFPDAGGYRFFLLDCADPDLAKKVSAHLTRMFGDRGLEMRPAAQRLNEFNAVQNTYLSIFSTLGGLGLLLGTLGLGMIVARNVMERRGELGLMQAIGFTRRSIADMVLAEHWFLHVAGVLIGILAAVIAVIPKLSSAGSALPWKLLLSVNVAVLLGGLLFCWIAARTVVRGKLMDGLRRE